MQTSKGLNLKNILQGVDSSLSNNKNGGSSSGIIDMSFHGDISSVPYNTQNTNMSLQQGISWGANISKPRYSSSSPLMFGADGKVAGLIQISEMHLLHQSLMLNLTHVL